MTTTISSAENAAISSAPRELVQVPADLLTSLLASAEELRKDVHRLRDENSTLASELRRVDESSGEACRRFTIFPAEIRRLIWIEALTTPQILIMTDQKISRSHINLVMRSCKEATDVGLSLHLPYYQIFTATSPRFGGPKQYFNLDVDTIWVEGRLSLVPDCVEFTCGTCPDGAALFPMLKCNNLNECTHNRRLRRIAINYSDWHPPDRGGYFRAQKVGNTDILRHFNSVHELYIVTGDTSLSNERDVYFDKPDRNLSAKFVGDQVEPHLPCSATWEKSATDLEETFRMFKKSRADQRKLELSLSVGASKLEMDQNNFMDISSWEPPKVRFVEAFTNEKWWFRPIER